MADTLLAVGRMDTEGGQGPGLRGFRQVKRVGTGLHLLDGGSRMGRQRHQIVHILKAELQAPQALCP